MPIFIPILTLWLSSDRMSTITNDFFTIILDNENGEDSEKCEVNGNMNSSEYVNSDVLLNFIDSVNSLLFVKNTVFEKPFEPEKIIDFEKYNVDANVFDGWKKAEALKIFVGSKLTDWLKYSVFVNSSENENFWEGENWVVLENPDVLVKKKELEKGNDCENRKVWEK